MMMLRQGLALHLVRALYRDGSKLTRARSRFAGRCSSFGQAQLSAPQPCRALTVSSWPFSSPPRDYSLPNESWAPEMTRLYEHYNALCEAEVGEEGEKKRGPWRRLPSYNRTLKYATGGRCLSKVLQAKARLFTRNIEEPGAAFEYVVFLNKEEKSCVCVLQAGHLLEGPPGHVHGGATATIIDGTLGTLATYVSGPVMTANLNINYRSPISLGSVVLVHCELEKIEGRKTTISCRVTSADGDKLHTQATGEERRADRHPMPLPPVMGKSRPPPNANTSTGPAPVESMATKSPLTG